VFITETQPCTARSQGFDKKNEFTWNKRMRSLRHPQSSPKIIHAKSNNQKVCREPRAAVSLLINKLTATKCLQAGGRLKLLTRKFYFSWIPEAVDSSHTLTGIHHSQKKTEVLQKSASLLCCIAGFCGRGVAASSQKYNWNSCLNCSCLPNDSDVHSAQNVAL